MRQVCHEFSISRQAYYKRITVCNGAKLPEAMIVTFVRDIRRKQPRIGGRKLFKKLQSRFKEQHIQIGRDRFFDVLRKYQLLVPRQKRTTRTTQSYHRFHTYGNLVKSTAITGPNQVYVADITYLRLITGFCYLALITDAYSRKIVGYNVSDSLSIDGSIRALKMALKGVKQPHKLIHHSDRGIQYCSHDYIRILKKKQVTISMTEENHVYENALAERVNGILKYEFMLGETLVSMLHAKKLVRDSIQIYNKERPHMSIDYMTPELKHAA